jgi:8-oxo-dGTP pyrophosphatase MutT (NUDIX family)
VALKREVREETGYDVEVGALIGVYSKPFQDDIVLGFEARITGRSAWSPTHEIAEVRFFPQQELPDGFTAVARQRIEDGFRGLRGAFHEFSSAE